MNFVTVFLMICAILTAVLTAPTHPSISLDWWSEVYKWILSPYSAEFMASAAKCGEEFVEFQRNETKHRTEKWLGSFVIRASSVSVYNIFPEEQIYRRLYITSKMALNIRNYRFA